MNTASSAAQTDQLVDLADSHRLTRDDPAIDGLLGDVRDLEAEARQLREALLTRAPIDQAKGMLMQSHGVDAEAAFRILVQWSSVTNQKLRVIAQAVVEIASRSREPSQCDPAVLAMVRELLETTGVSDEGAA